MCNVCHDFDEHDSQFKREFEIISEIWDVNLDAFNQIVLVEAGKSPKTLAKKDLVDKTDDGRERRGTNSMLMKYDFDKKTAQKLFGNQYNMITYKVQSQETTEYKDGVSPEKPHYGYIIYNNSNKRVKQVYCNCRDFLFRLFYAYDKAGFADMDFSEKYMKDKVNIKHNRQAPKVLNLDGTLFLCKHLYKAMTDVLDMNSLADIVLAREDGLDDEQKELAKTIEKDIRAQGDEEGNDVVDAVEKKRATKKPVAKKTTKKVTAEPVGDEETKSEFEKEYDKFNDDLETDKKKELTAYEKKKKTGKTVGDEVDKKTTAVKRTTAKGTI